MAKITFDANDIVFREGEASTAVLLIERGEVEILKEVGAESVVLGQVGSGEFVGEMGVIEGRPRSATVRALSRVEGELVEREDFLARVSSDSSLAFNALLRLSERLHAADERIAEAAAPEPVLAAAAPEQPVVDGIIELASPTEALHAALPRDGMRLRSFPFAVGREPTEGETRPAAAVDLALADRVPYRLSRVHFSILQAGRGFVVSDTTSTLGTSVNGDFIGEHFPRVRAPLREGENTVIAGGPDSPFVFTVTVR